MPIKVTYNEWIDKILKQCEKLDMTFLDASSNFKGYTETCDLSFYNEITEIMKNHLQP